MNLSLPTNLTFPRRSRGRCVANQALQECLEIDAVVEPIGERAEVVAGVLVELERLVAPANHRLEVAQDGVDPGELRKVAGLALADDDVRVGAACVNDTGEAVQAVAADVAAWQQIGLGPPSSTPK